MKKRFDKTLPYLTSWKHFASISQLTIIYTIDIILLISIGTMRGMLIETGIFKKEQCKGYEHR